MKKLALTLILAGCLLVPVSRAEKGDPLYTMAADRFFRLDRVGQPIDLSRIDKNLLSAAIFHETNQRRKNQGLAPLDLLPGLHEAAEMHANSMARGGYLSHTNPDDPKRKTPWDRVRLTGLKPSYVSENVATHFGIRYEPGTRAYPSKKNGDVRFSRTPGGPPIPNHTYRSIAESLLDQWMGSPPHRKNIVSERAHYLGAACAKREPETRTAMVKFFCVQVFAAL